MYVPLHYTNFCLCVAHIQYIKAINIQFVSYSPSCTEIFIVLYVCMFVSTYAVDTTAFLYIFIRTYLQTWIHFLYKKHAHFYHCSISVKVKDVHNLERTKPNAPKLHHYNNCHSSDAATAVPPRFISLKSH